MCGLIDKRIPPLESWDRGESVHVKNIVLQCLPPSCQRKELLPFCSPKSIKKGTCQQFVFLLYLFPFSQLAFSLALYPPVSGGPVTSLLGLYPPESGGPEASKMGCYSPVR